MFTGIVTATGKVAHVQPLEKGLRLTVEAPGLKLAEWPEKAAGLLPLADWVLHIRPGDDDARHVTVHAPTALGARLLQDMPL